jgi:large subunit ribosomal protein L32e
MTDNKPTLAQVAGKRPRKKFLRYEWFKCKKLGLAWRRPVGLHSKTRQGRKGKPPVVNAGYGHPVATRGMLNGFKPFIIRNVADLQRVDVKRHAPIIASVVGLRTAAEIATKAEQMGITILNTKKIAHAQHRVRMIVKNRADRANAEKKPEVKHDGKQHEVHGTPVVKHETPVVKHEMPVVKHELTHDIKHETKPAAVIVKK